LLATSRQFRLAVPQKLPLSVHPLFNKVPQGRGDVTA
jgi:hypothetical protein